MRISFIKHIPLRSKYRSPDQRWLQKILKIQKEQLAPERGVNKPNRVEHYQAQVRAQLSSSGSSSPSHNFQTRSSTR